MTMLLLAVASCLLTAFILMALAMIFGGPDPLRDKELEDLAAEFVRVKHQRFVEARANDMLVEQIGRLTRTIDDLAAELSLKNSMVETLANVVNDRTGRGGIGGLGGH